MKQIWKKKTEAEIKKTVFDALSQNVNYNEQNILGIPASHLDEKVFNQDVSFVKDAPFISSLIQNPNHIGCHTRGKSEAYFAGTQKLEKELLEICGVDILKGKIGEQDGYVASGGTEANIQAIWVYRNYFKSEFSAQNEEICILCSEDSHYSMDKAGNLLGLSVYKVAVDHNDRSLLESSLKEVILKAQKNGVKYYAVVCNMMTTMFGSIDDVDLYTNQLKAHSCNFKLHVDGAYGGFYYPFTDESNNKLSFVNPKITSFTLDAHKMAQAPYGTGIFLIRKGFIEFTNTKAGYVEGEDFTLIGSRSGANAVAVWMILSKNGPYGWYEKILILQNRTNWMCTQLDSQGIEYFRHEKSNIITIKSEFINFDIAHKFGLVPDSHSKPNWFKIVIMDHVSIEKLMLLLTDLKPTA